MSNMNNNVERNNNGEKERSTILGVSENSFMHKCYIGSMARITGYDVLEFLRGYIKGLVGDVGVIYSQNPETREIDVLLAIPYKANTQQNNRQQNNTGMIPIPGLNGSRNGRINESVLKSINKIKMDNYQPSVLYKEDAILFRIDFGVLVAEMMNPSKGYAVSIDNIELNGQSDMVAIVSVFKSRNANNVNRMTRVLQGHGKFNRQQNQQQAQRYNGSRR